MCVYVRFYNTQFNVAKTCLSQDTFILSVMAVTKIIGIRFLVSALALNACVCIICKCTRVCCPRMLVWYILLLVVITTINMHALHANAHAGVYKYTSFKNTQQESQNTCVCDVLACLMFKFNCTIHI